MKNLKIFGDSIIKGVTYNGQSYHLCQEHDFDTLRAQGVTVELLCSLFAQQNRHFDLIELCLQFFQWVRQ